MALYLTQGNASAELMTASGVELTYAYDYQVALSMESYPNTTSLVRLHATVKLFFSGTSGEIAIVQMSNLEVRTQRMHSVWPDSSPMLPIYALPEAGEDEAMHNHLLHMQQPVQVWRNDNGDSIFFYADDVASAMNEKRAVVSLALAQLEKEIRECNACRVDNTSEVCRAENATNPCHPQHQRFESTIHGVCGVNYTLTSSNTTHHNITRTVKDCFLPLHTRYECGLSLAISYYLLLFLIQLTHLLRPAGAV